MMERLVVLDTNFMLVPYQFKIDIFSEIERICPFKYSLCVVRQTVEELEKLSSSEPGEDRRAAALGLSLIKAKGIKIVESRQKNKTLKNADEFIIDLARAQDCIIATQDQGLKTRLEGLSVPLIVMRQKSHLELLA